MHGREHAMEPMLTTHQKDQLLDALMHYLGPETRRKIMRELPEAYNTYFGREIVKVVMPS